MISVVLPAFNEEAFIKEVIDRTEAQVRASSSDYEIIVVNDGSSDNTQEIVNTVSERNPWVRQVSFERNRGKGYALKRGFWEAKGDLVVFLDSDLDIDPSQLGMLIGGIGDADILIASKWHSESSVSMPLFRRFQSKAFNTLVRFFTDLSFKDTQVGLKVMRRRSVEEVIERSFVDRFAFDVEFLVLSRRLGLKVVESPVKLSIPKQSLSLRDLVQMLYDIITVGWRYRD